MAHPDLRVPREIDCSTLAVKGRLPADLDGTLFRISPDGCGDRPGTGQPYVGALRIRQGRAEWYLTRRVRTDAVCRQTGELPSPGPRRCSSDNTAEAVIRHGRQILALGDGVLPYELTPDLRTKARCDFDDTLPSGFSSRPIHDPLTGELFAAVAVPRRRALRYVAVDIRGRVRKYEPVPVSDDPTRYAFALTERYALFLGPDEIGVLPREGGREDVMWVGAVPGCPWTRRARSGPADRPVNAFELRDGAIVVDLVRDDGHRTPSLRRRRVDPERGVIRDELVDARAQDLPTVDPRYQGSYYRHAVTRLLTGDGRSGTALIRHDLTEGTSRLHHAEPGRYLGAPVFVPDSPSAGEGDGWVLVFAHNTALGHDEAVVIDTTDFAGPPVAVIELPTVGPRESSACWLVENPW
ncbi:carotenoid oxygenase family protein [Actinoallomurus vinaceus]|uniref:Dioxygenase n=1 Tax=Actinoallomurus vinaceus TaxID=1080074 RepID=A0ABP8TZR1_9ACTN